MHKEYIKFILAYDYGWIFGNMDLACDEAYELAEEIANRFLKLMASTYANKYSMSDYELLQEYCDSISFDEIWNEMRGK